MKKFRITAVYYACVMVMISFFSTLTSCSKANDENPGPQPDPVETAGFRVKQVIVDMTNFDEEIDVTKDEVSFYICKDVDTYEKQVVIIAEVKELEELKENGFILVDLDKPIIIPHDKPFYCYGEHLGLGAGKISPTGDFKITIPKDEASEIPKDKIIDAPGPIGVTGFSRHE
ncbi:hypothetical protein KMW28_21090 [Flammeovirga yaeyamensis]|uniref:Lipoprotein n=1 Tax=Flammeovirga yaeyamensis TaxID=367791 RepID=A0AAX1NBM8_9BACT|nr:hypothetical protein [Flammeovirga yaeyamensis]MBB3697155.1 hypothetical protein [Flammeovirga yaeyamensis]NMF33815.1 hypothetical protein [Flammeovirga yaeyamensis]QWG04921.1 hypothetical protein KMW28_21090 [Flammeovirga yaeyamensis]